MTLLVILLGFRGSVALKRNLSEMKRTEAHRGTNVALVFTYAGHPSHNSQFYGLCTYLSSQMFLLGESTQINYFDSLR